MECDGCCYIYTIFAKWEKLLKSVHFYLAYLLRLFLSLVLTEFKAKYSNNGGEGV